MILGTAAYMSPEQARGKPVDRRADIWALGGVLFETADGPGPCFPGETITDTLAAVVRAEPDWETLPPETPPCGSTGAAARAREGPRAQTSRCRGRTAGDRRSVGRLERTREITAGVPAPTTVPRGRWVRCRLGAGRRRSGPDRRLGLARAASRRPDRAPARFEIVGATGETLIDPWSLTISPDGRRIAWVVIDGAEPGDLPPRDRCARNERLPDTDGAKAAFSPDGQSIAFFANKKLRRFDLGRPPRGRPMRCDQRCRCFPGETTARSCSITAGSARYIASQPRAARPNSRPVWTSQDGEIGHWFPDLLPDGTARVDLALANDTQRHECCRRLPRQR